MGNLGVIIGETITDRKSIFQAFIFKIEEEKDITNIKPLLLANNKIAKATHNIAAYRYISKNKPKIEENLKCNYFDDGETGAGERLLGILEKLKVYNIYVMVSRWYGGINLGNDRFKHINDAAKNIILLNKDNFNYLSL